MSTMSQFFGGGGGFKSVQRGTITVSAANYSGASVTISSVNTAKSVLALLGASPTNNANYGPGLTLTNSTTITASILIIPGSGNTVQVFWQVTEYN